MRTAPATADIPRVLSALAAECLKMQPGDLSRQVPLTHYGLDSLATEEFRAAIEHVFDRRLPESVFSNYPDLESLDRYLTLPAAAETPPPDVRGLMLSDAKLPEEIRPLPQAGKSGVHKTVLLTGATGFLGVYLLRSLLVNTGATICCIARSTVRESAAERLHAAMSRYGLWGPAFEPRLTVVEGDLSLPGMGISAENYATLCAEVDAVYHCAATVNWVHSYDMLRRVNVLGTCDLLRLACAQRPKPFHFVSSAAVCYSTWGPLELDESCDVAPFMHGLHLGYAQSKCVAESLVRQAGERGLPVTIHRPSLLAADRVSARANLDDLLSRLIKGIILMGSAPDLDWSLDCCPVDYVADAIVHLTTSQSPPSVSHLLNPSPRHWRELVLWINLFGYPVRLLPYRQWLARLREEASPEHPLRGLVAFFAGEPAGEGGLTLPELYEDPRRSRVRSAATVAALLGSRVGSPGLNARLLDRYFRHYIDAGFLKPTLIAKRPGNTGGEKTLDTAFFNAVMGQNADTPGLLVCAVESVMNEGGHSIISELSSWQHGGTSGIDRYRLSMTHPGEGESFRSVVVKRKAKDEQLVATAGQIAGLCSDKLGEAFRRFGADLGLGGSHLREIGVYRQKDERFRCHAPVLYGARSDSDRADWALVLEDISGLELLNSAENSNSWCPLRMNEQTGNTLILIGISDSY